MHTDSSAIATCLRLRSTVECTATVRMPSAWQARRMRSAISPLFAMTTLSSIGRFRNTNGVFRDSGPGTRDSGKAEAGPCAIAVALSESRVPSPESRTCSADHEQRLVEFHRLAAFGEDLQDRAGNVGLDRVEHLHRLDDAQGVAGLDRLAD